MYSGDLLQRFRQRLTSAGGDCQYVETLQDAARVIAVHEALVAKSLIVPPAFSEHLLWGNIIPLLRQQDVQVHAATSPAEVADAPAGLSSAELAVAETGSVLLTENALEARIVSMLTLTHFVLVRVADLVPMLDEVGVRLQHYTRPGAGQRRYISLVTGPSRTADIERTLTIGVQGPRTLYVIFVQNMEVPQ